MLGEPLSRRSRLLLGAAAVVTLLAGYTVLSHLQHRRNPQDTTIPSWTQVAEGIGKLSSPHARSGERWIVEDSLATARRLFLGLALGVGGAFLLGIGMGVHPKLDAFLSPMLSLAAKVPPTAALAVFFVMVGTNIEMYVAMIAFGVLPSLAQSVDLGVKEVPRELIYKAYTIGASHAEVIWEVVVRHVLPKVIDGIRLQIGPAMVYLIAAEMVVGDVGFGYRIRLQSRLLNMNVVYPYLALLAAFGFAVDIGLRRLRQWACPWYLGGK